MDIIYKAEHKHELNKDEIIHLLTMMHMTYNYWLQLTGLEAAMLAKKSILGR